MFLSSKNLVLDLPFVGVQEKKVGTYTVFKLVYVNLFRLNVQSNTNKDFLSSVYYISPME